MKTTVFEIDATHGNFTLGNNKSEFTLDLLPAYAIEFCTLSLNGQTFPNGPDSFTVNGDKIRWEGNGFPLDDQFFLHLTIYYHGIRDYSLLFPRISDPDLRTRLGEYYQEAEISFDNNAKLSFCLMCGAIFEGLLHNVYPRTYAFNDKINQAHSDGRISANEASVMHTARLLRNLIHAGKFTDPFVTHLQMMDVRTTMDHLIKHFK